MTRTFWNLLEPSFRFLSSSVSCPQTSLVVQLETIQHVFHSDGFSQSTKFASPPPAPPPLLRFPLLSLYFALFSLSFSTISSFLSLSSIAFISSSPLSIFITILNLIQFKPVHSFEKSHFEWLIIIPHSTVNEIHFFQSS